MVKLDLEMAEEPEIKLPTSVGSSKKEESSRKMSNSAFDYAKDFVRITTTVGNSERDVSTRPPDLPPEKSVCRKEGTVRTGHRATDWFRIRKEVCQDCILSLCCLTYMQTTSCKMPG